MKTATRIALIIAATAIAVKTGMICKETYSCLHTRYVSEAKGQAQAFINSWMY